MSYLIKSLLLRLALLTPPIRKAINKAKSFCSVTVGKINWTSTRVMTEHEFALLKDKLKDNYYVIATRHNGHLSTYVISFAHLILTGKFGYYGHVLMNVENEVKTDSDFRFIEATGLGIHYSSFDEAFDSQTGSVALIKPKKMTAEHWTKVLDNARANLGKPYDTLFDMSNDLALSCVELVYCALKAEPNFAEDFAEFEKMVFESENLDPQMFLECSDFEVVWEIRS